MKNFTFSVIFSLLVVSASFAGGANVPGEKKKKDKGCKTEKSDCKKSDGKKKCCESKTETKESEVK
jgi:hypothetical protein